MDEEEERRSVMFMGRDLLKIPCFRTTFLYSISSWVGVSLVTFLFTSKAAFSSHCGFATFMGVTGGYFIYCRQKYAEEKFRMGQLRQGWHKGAVLQGTKDDVDSPRLVDA